MDATRISYAAWGEQFFELAISEDRILGAVRGLAGQPIEFGPIGVGPRRIAKVIANGQIGEARALRREGMPITYDLVLPVGLEFTVDLLVEKERFDAELLLPITLIARALDGVGIHIDARPPTADQIEVTLEADGRRAKLLQRVAGVDGELARFVAKYVARELEKPHIAAARSIDVAGLIGKAWQAPQHD